MQEPDRQIPLQCCVCPRSPGFSDVSHLLTHIASKGHLHHETQMKLRSHQDISSAMALRQYDAWYNRYSIEDLLVERMKAKQVKEAARQTGKRKTSLNPMALAPSRVSNINAIENATNEIFQMDEPENILFNPESADVYTPLPSYPDLLSPADEPGLPDFHKVEASKLKGQYWPGMDKLDLANDDMKRTRNQRKPKSSVDRMQRASESIEPTQVVMNLNFEVEVVKGVYDASSPPVIEEDTVLFLLSTDRLLPTPY